MEGQAVIRENIEGVLACYKIMDYDVMDPETVVATFHNDPEKVVEWFDAAEEMGMIEHVQGSMYRMTEEGEELLNELLLRGANDS